MPPSTRKCKCSEGKTLYRLKVIRSLDGDIAELFYEQTDELIARGTGPRKKSKSCWRVSYAKQHREERMVDNPVWEICERVAQVQALFDDHIAGGKHTAADVVAKGPGGAVRAQAAPGYVRCRLLPAEHAAGLMSRRGSYAPNSRLEG
jgi:hypothetical protein